MRALTAVQHVIGFMRDVTAREADVLQARERLCVTFAPLLARPRVPQEKEQRAQSMRAVARALLTLVLVEELMPPGERSTFQTTKFFCLAFNMCVSVRRWVCGFGCRVETAVRQAARSHGRECSE